MRLLLFLLLPLSALSATVYCSPSGGGSGADFNNLATLPNTTGFTRGDTYVIVDGAYAGKTLSEPVSGSALVTIRKASAADSAVAGYASTLHDGEATFSGTISFTTSFWVFNGVSGGGPSSWTSGHGFAINHTGSAGEGVNFAASSIVVAHTKLTGNNGSHDVNADSFSWGGTGNNITVSNCYTTQAGRCVIFCNQTATNVLFERNYFGSIQGFGDVHGETGSIWGDPVNWTLRYNLITDVDSTGGFMWDNVSTPTGSFWIYGNIFYDIGQAWGFHGNGVIGGWTGGNNEECHNVKVYNNTFVTVDSEIACLGSNPNIRSGLEAKNNLFYSCANVDAAIWTATHNHFISSESVGTSTSTDTGDPFTNLAGLDFSLTEDTTAGDSISSAYRTDMFGNTGTTRGAIQFVAQGGGGGVGAAYRNKGRATRAGGIIP